MVLVVGVVVWAGVVAAVGALDGPPHTPAPPFARGEDGSRFVALDASGLPSFELPAHVAHALRQRGHDPALFVPDPLGDDHVHVVRVASEPVAFPPEHEVELTARFLPSNSTTVDFPASFLETEVSTETGRWWWWWIGWVIQCKGFYYYWWHRHWWRAPWGRWYRFWVLHRGFHWWNCHQCVVGKGCVWCNRHCRVDAKKQACSLCLVYLDGQNVWREEYANRCPWSCPRQPKEPYELYDQ